MKLLVLLLSLQSFAQTRPSLQDVSKRMNNDLPEVWDSITKLLTTTTENNNFIYHFIVNASQKEFDGATPKVKAQIMSTICGKARERSILKDHRANIVYRYENLKGQSLGEFMIRPEHCLKK